MMRVEKRLIGVLVMSLMVGSLISLYLIKEKIETPINVIDQSFPLKALAGVSELDQDKYSVAFICREALKQVAVSFSYLVAVRPNLTEASPRVDDAEKAGEKIEQISGKLALMQDLGYDPEVTVADVSVGGEKRTIVVYDFGAALNPILPPSGSSYYATVYAVVLNKSKMIESFYEGVSDYFFMREISLKGLEITVNANKTTYVSADDKAGLAAGALPALGAPGQGRIVFSDLARNDRVSIIYRIGSTYSAYPKLFAKQVHGKYLVHMVKFEIDGELATDKILIHIIENGGYVEV